jgi:signal transduction histidine kinase
MISASQVRKKSNIIFSLYLMSAFLFIIVIISLSALFYFQKKKSDEELYKRTQESFVSNVDQKVTGIFDMVISDLKIVSKHSEFTSFLDGGKNSNLDKLANEFLEFSRFKGVYDQVRFLDETGMEKIRINYSDGEPYVVAKEDLQYKGDRYYFYDAFTLEENEIFISPFDLNIEGGKIEDPIKPMIRIATPIYHNGEKRGVLLVNYLGGDLLESIVVGIQDGIKVNFLNQDGYWLYSTDGDNDWAFMYDDKLDLNLPKLDADLWKMLDSHEEKQFLSNGYLYTSTTINPYVMAQSSSSGNNKAFSPSLTKLNPLKHKWELYTAVPESVLYSGSSQLLIYTIVADSMIVFAVIIILLILRRSSKERLESEIKINSLNDILQVINKILRHDLANSFTAVKNSLEVYVDDKSAEALENANGAVESGIRLINKMRQLESAMSNGEDQESLSVGDVVNKAVLKVPLEVTIDGSARVMADQAFEVVFKNLASNAVRHGGAKKIKVTIAKLDKSIRIEFADDGSGIPTEVQEKIFEEGFKSGSTGNTGLGLYLAKKTIERYAGSIKVEDNHPKGAKFIIVLPAID